MVETIRVNMKVDREIQKRISRNGQDRIFALKLDNSFCPMTAFVTGKITYPIKG